MTAKRETVKINCDTHSPEKKYCNLSEEQNMPGIRSITYRYQGSKPSTACMRHVFRHLSALYDIKFIEDPRSPDLFWGDKHAAPDSARIIFLNGENDIFKIRFKDPSTGEFLSGLNYNPLESLAIRLSIRGNSGPFASRPSIPSGPAEKTLSAVVSELYNILCQTGLIENRARTIALWRGPARFGMAITHDIDIVRRSVGGSLRLLFNRALPGGWEALKDTLKSTLKIAPNPYDAIGKWIVLENSLGVKSTFFIFDGRRRHPLDPKYGPDKISPALELIRQNDMEIALHSSVECYAGKGIPEAKLRLEESAVIKCGGVRPHYLSAFLPEYWWAAAKAGFAYASTLGFDRDIGYLDGIDLPFYPFDSVKDEPIPLLEIPISVMDCGLIREQAADSEQVFERAMGIIDRAAATAGLIVLDWHQRASYNRDYPGWSGLFTKIVRYAGGKGACFLRMDELAADFEKRFGS
jgi:hypothetical protein